MKVYTGTGDRGKTSLFSGERIEKSAPRVEAYGDVDELNARRRQTIKAMYTLHRTAVKSSIWVAIMNTMRNWLMMNQPRPLRFTCSMATSKPCPSQKRKL